MKRDAVDTGAPVPVSDSKDKRTLVLFVLALLILIVDLLPVGKLETSSVYAVLPEKDWQVLKVAAIGHQEKAGQGGLDLLPQNPLAGMHVLPLDPSRTPPRELPAVFSLLLHRPLPINRADRATLELLPGVGPHLAAAIARERQRRGTLNGPDDLLNVPGIGPKSLQSLLPLVSFQ
jgi:competence protein ComEA